MPFRQAAIEVLVILMVSTGGHAEGATHMNLDLRCPSGNLWGQGNGPWFKSKGLVFTSAAIGLDSVTVLRPYGTP
ncbi:hypothetical protein DFH07DRAFT_950099 [Mycena maculata]|uniref:Uncharacterized protein n=1 Tax=Mycena maculata TaxID=230809 RepID=A0AAD7K9V4_9AGAR|nr:hypothetical protein DFH07DRAFT_950099 [Mycena maculata]